MAGAFKKSLVWLGLVEPEDDEELADVAEAAGRSPADRAPIRRVRDDDVYGRRRDGGRLDEPTEAETAKRLIDFAAGLTFGLDGRIQRVADKVFLLTPRNVEVSAEERRRLQERGFFNQA